MKDTWLQQQECMRRISIETNDDLPKPVQPRRVWRIKGVRGCYEWAVPLSSGDLIAVVCVVGEAPRFTMTYQTQPPLQPYQYLHCNDNSHTHTVQFFCELYDDMFLTLDYDSMLRAYCARTNVLLYYIEFDDQSFTDMEVVQTNDNKALIVISDQNGSIHLVRHHQHSYSTAQRKRIRYHVLHSAHPAEITEITAAGAKFAAASVDGLVTIWDASKRMKVGQILNSRPVKIMLDWNHLVSYTDNVVRVYDAKRGYKLKHVIPLPTGPDLLEYPMLNLLSDKMVVYHDEASCIVFFDLATGKVVHRVQSPFRAVNCFKILKDLSIVLSSEEETEGHAVVSIPHHDAVHEALTAHAYCKYGAVMPIYKERKWWQPIVLSVCIAAFWRITHSILTARRLARCA